MTPTRNPFLLLSPVFQKAFRRIATFAIRTRQSSAPSLDRNGPVKLGAAALAVTMLAGCSTFAGGGNDTPSVDLSAVEAAQTRVAALQVEVSRLKSENARLANQLLDIQRERARAQNAAREEAEAADTDESAAAQEQATVPDPLPLANAVVDTANDPAIAQSDVPVENAPRLVQPAFASNETVFENEADENAIETTSVLFGVHLASYRARDEARDGWRQLQRANPDELGLLEPRVENVVIEDKGVFLRLIGGGFSSRDRASALCDVLKTKGQFCSVVGFAGQRLSLADETG